MVVDTGSSDLIINSPESDLCATGSCDVYRTYDPSASTSAKWVNDEMQVQYEVFGLNGSWFQDDITFGENKVPQWSIGSGNSSTSVQNIWGFGFSGYVDGTPNIPNPDTTLQTIAKAGLTNSASVSIYLNQTGSPTGSILFGGVDTSLYTGDLITLPVEQSNGGYDRLAVNLNSVSIKNGDASISSTTGLPARVLLDTGNFDIKLPPNITQDIYNAFNITQTFTLSGNDFAFSPCSLADNPQVLSFGFEGVDITVPMKSLVMSPPDYILKSLGLDPSIIPDGTCLFLVNNIPEGVIEAGGLLYILGGAFLSNAYFVFDQDAEEVGLAQANFNPGPSSIREIAAGKSGLDDLNGAGSGTPSSSALPPLAGSARWLVAGTATLGFLLSL